MMDACGRATFRTSATVRALTHVSSTPSLFLNTAWCVVSAVERRARDARDGTSSAILAISVETLPT